MSTQKTLAVSPPRRPRADVGTHGNLPRSPTVLLLVDFINPLEFPEAADLAQAALGAAKAAHKLKARLQRNGSSVIYTNDNYGRWRSDFREVHAQCVARGGVAAEMAQMLAPTPRDFVVLKPRHSAFYGTPLDLMLTQMHAKTLVIAGLATDICVQLTAMDASLRGYKLWVPGDCTAAEAPALKGQALDYMRRVLKADVGVWNSRWRSG